MVKKLFDLFPNAKAFGLFDLILEVFETGQSQELDLNFYQYARVSEWKKNRISKLPNGNIMVICEDLTAQKELELELTREKNFSKMRKRLRILEAGNGIWPIICSHGRMSSFG